MKSIIHLGLTYGVHPKPEEEEKEKAKAKVPVSQSTFSLIRYTDSNYVSNPEDKKLVMRHCFFIYGAHSILV